MLAFEKWWAECVQRRPQLMNSSAKMTLTVNELKANLKRAFDAGVASKPKSPLQELSDLFGTK
jgi:hypothetical protein